MPTAECGTPGCHMAFAHDGPCTPHGRSGPRDRPKSKRAREWEDDEQEEGGEGDERPYKAQRTASDEDQAAGPVIADTSPGAEGNGDDPDYHPDDGAEGEGEDGGGEDGDAESEWTPSSGDEGQDDYDAEQEDMGADVDDGEDGAADGGEEEEPLEAARYKEGEVVIGKWAGVNWFLAKVTGVYDDHRHVDLTYFDGDEEELVEVRVHVRGIADEAEALYAGDLVMAQVGASVAPQDNLPWQPAWIDRIIVDDLDGSIIEVELTYINDCEPQSEILDMEYVLKLARQEWLVDDEQEDDEQEDEAAPGPADEGAEEAQPMRGRHGRVPRLDVAAQWREYYDSRLRVPASWPMLPGASLVARKRTVTDEWCLDRESATKFPWAALKEIRSINGKPLAARHAFLERLGPDGRRCAKCGVNLTVPETRLDHPGGTGPKSSDNRNANGFFEGQLDRNEVQMLCAFHEDEKSARPGGAPGSRSWRDAAVYTPLNPAAYDPEVHRPEIDWSVFGGPFLPGPLDMREPPRYSAVCGAAATHALAEGLGANICSARWFTCMHRLSGKHISPFATYDASFIGTRALTLSGSAPLRDTSGLS